MSEEEYYLKREKGEERGEIEEEKEEKELAEKAFEDHLIEEQMKDYRDLRTILEQDYNAWKVAKQKGIDLRDSFRVMRIGEEGGNPHYHVFTSGEEGQKKTEEMLNEMNRSRFVVDNKMGRRLTLEDIKEKFKRSIKGLKGKGGEIEWQDI